MLTSANFNFYVSFQTVKELGQLTEEATSYYYQPFIPNSHYGTVQEKVIYELNNPTVGSSLPSGWTATATIGGATAFGLEAVAYRNGDQIVIFAGGQQLDGDGNAYDNLYTQHPIANDAVPPTAFELVNFYKQIEAQNPNANITLAGHSLGASVAKLAGAILQSESTEYYEKVQVLALAGWGENHLLDNLGLKPNADNIINIYTSYDKAVGPYAGESNNFGKVLYTAIIENDPDDTHHALSSTDFSTLDWQRDLSNLHAAPSGQDTLLSMLKWQQTYYNNFFSTIDANAPILLNATNTGDNNSNYLMGQFQYIGNYFENLNAIWPGGGIHYNDSMLGLGGNDVLFGDKGDDTLIGGAGDDLLYGSLGDDTFQYDSGDGVDTVRNAFGQNETLKFDLNRSEVTLYSSANTVITEYGSLGNLVIELDEANKVIVENQFNTSKPGVGVEHFKFNDGDIYAGTLYGDTAIGGLGDDVAYTFEGDDLLTAGQGNDTLHGGAGDDTYAFSLGDGQDVLVDVSGNDILEFGEGITYNDLKFEKSGQDLIVKIKETTDQITLKDYYAEGNNNPIDGFAFTVDPEGLVNPNDPDEPVDPVRAGELSFKPNYKNFIVGTEEDDNYHNDSRLIGISNGDVILGLEGNDELYGEFLYAYDYPSKPSFIQAAGDYLIGGDGNDELYGDGGGAFTSGVVFQGETNFLIGGNGDDFVVGSAIIQTDYETGGIFQLSSGRNFLSGDAGNDLLIGGFQFSQQSENFSAITYKGASNSLSGGSGVDILYGDGVISAIQADSAINYTGGSNILYGGSGDGALYGGAVIQTYGGSVNYTGGGNLLDGGTSLFGDGNILSYSENEVSVNYKGGKNSLSTTYAALEMIGNSNIEIQNGDIKAIGGSNYLSAGLGSEGIAEFKGFGNVTTYFGNSYLRGGNSILIGSDGQDWISGEGDVRASQNSTLIGGNNRIFGGDSKDRLVGNGRVFSNDAGNAILIGGDNYLEGGGGNDVMTGGGQIISGSGVGKLEGGKDTLWGNSGNDEMYGDAQFVANESGTAILIGGNDILHGKDDNDYLMGDGEALATEGAGDVKLIGGDDTLAGGNGRDFIVGDGLANLQATGNVIYQGGNDWLEGNGGNDLLVGDGSANRNTSSSRATYYAFKASGYGADDELFPFLDWFRDRIDGINTSHPFGTLSAEAGHDSLYGGSGNDWLIGDGPTLTVGGDDLLVGGTGNDVLKAGLGDDVYRFNLGDGVDLIQEGTLSDTTGNNVLLAGGFDTLEFGPDIAQEDVIFTADGNDLVIMFDGTTDQITIENQLSPTAIGRRVEQFYFTEDSSLLSYVDILETLIGSNASAVNGTSGDDYLLGTATYQHIQGLGGDDYIIGNSLGDTLDGGDGNDTLDAGTGNDTVIGGAGDDVFLIHAANVNVIENSNEGIDTVETSLSHTLSSNVEHLTLTGTGNSSGTGNSLDNQIIGNSGNNTLDGSGGNDTLLGHDGNDTYVYAANAGDDWIQDTQGSDTLQFATGIASTDANFNYDGAHLVVSVDGATGETVIANQFDPFAFQGQIDAFQFSGGPTLTAAEVLDLAGDSGSSLLGTSGADFILGNASNQALSGDDGDDTLQGGSGNDSIEGNTGSDLLVGNGGSDTLAGGEGNDLYFVEDTSDTLIENADEGVDTVYATANHTLADQMETLILAGSDNLEGVGNTAANTLQGNTGNNRLTGAGGDDSMYGGSGNDTYEFSAGDGVDTLYEGVYLYGDLDVSQEAGSNDTLTFNGIHFNELSILRSGDDLVFQLAGTADQVTIHDHFRDSVRRIETFEFAGSVVKTYGEIESALTLVGTSGDETLTGESYAELLSGLGGQDTLLGNAGDDTLDGGTGNDSLIGGLGNDTYVVDSTSDSISEADEEGLDTVQASLSYALGNPVENLVLSGSDHLSGTGNALDNRVTGNGGHNTLDGGIGVDTLMGGIGNDVYRVDNASDVVIENSAEGADTVQSSVSYTLGNQVETLTLLGTASLSATGNDLDNVLIGNSGKNTLDGGLGADTLVGGLGNDTYRVDNVGDVVSESSNAGLDTVESTINYTLTADVEQLTLLGSSNLTGTGNALNNVLMGNAGVNTLVGHAGNDRLEGGSGADSLVGGTGDDTYGVDDSGDAVIEVSNEGIDTVQASITVNLATLSEHVENLSLSGSSAIHGTGNDRDNLLLGNTAGNSLGGGAGNDLLDGGAGNDTLSGGTGNDSYLVTDAGDTVVEASGAGTDTIYSTVSYTASAHVENLALLGGDAINAMGNTLNNLLIGNSGANSLEGGLGTDTLDGGIGADTLAGGKGHDLYRVDDAGDLIIENVAEGVDTVESSINYILGDNVENLTLMGSGELYGIGNSIKNVLIGNGGANSLEGGGGADTLDGGMGADTLVGGAGYDIYGVDDAGDLVFENAAEGIDTVESSISYTLGSNVENLTLLGTDALNGVGNSLKNVLVGNSNANSLTADGGEDTLDGGVGADTLIGGAGYDLYRVDNVGDLIIENGAEGFDTVESSVSFTLGSNIENLTLTGSGNLNGVGNTLQNVLIGNSGANSLDGGSGMDTLDGGAGVDTLAGGQGHDVYQVDSASELIIENAAEGIDTVESSVSFTLASNVENLTLIGTTNLNGTGNALKNLLIGNTGANTLDAGGGADTLDAGSGNDTLLGGSHDDVYQFAQGDGQDVISDSAGAADKVVFDSSVSLSNVVLYQTGAGNLQIGYTDSSGDLITVQGQSTSSTKVERFELSSGQFLTAADVNQVLADMVSYATTNSVSLTSLDDVKADEGLIAIVNGAWQS